MISEKNTLKVKIFFILLLIILPWSLVESSKTSTALYIDDSSVGYYQTNTCEISLAEVVLKNWGNNNIVYTLDNYSSIGCFGKINGLDKTDSGFKVGVGTNILVSFLYQSILWITLLSFIPRKNLINFKYPFLSSLIFCFLVVLHIYGEQDFYKVGSRNFDINFALDNYFLLSFLLIIFIIYFLFNQVFSTRVDSLLLYFPFLFLLVGTYDSMNLNIYLLMFVFFGIQYLLINRLTQKNLRYTIIYILIVNFAWLKNSSYSVLFDVDKIRGFANSSNTKSSILMWSIGIYFMYFGIKYCLQKTDLNITTLFRNFLLSGGLVTFMGIFGSISPVANFVIYYFFGLNKNSITGIESIQGNTWRGFSSSAEAIGEFYSVVFFMLVYLLMTKKIKVGKFEIFLIVLNLYGFIRANSFSSYISLIFVIALLVVISKFTKYRKAFLVTGLIMTPILITGILHITNTSYETSNKSIILESMKYSNLFEGELDRSINVTRFFTDEDDLGTIFLYPQNSEKISSSLEFLINRYTPNINIPLLPNPVATISTVSYVINRSEKWGIFFSKYDPNMQQLFFGHGPMQFVNYFNDFNKNNIDGLVLPHSSIINSLLFFGLTGLTLGAYLIFRNIAYSWDGGNVFSYLLVLQIMNLAKSDSILYVSSFVLFLVIYLKSSKESHEL